MTDRTIDLLRAALRVALVPSGAEPDAADVSLVSSAGEGEWRRLLPDVANHRLGPLLWRALRSRRLVGRLPVRARSELEGAHRGTLLANTVLRQFLARLLEDLRARGVEPVVTKGAVLEDWLYPELGTRPMLDLDVTVDAADEASAIEHLVAQGFRRHAPWAAFVHPGSGMAVDLHVATPSAQGRATRTIEVPGMAEVQVQSWEPNAALVHLAAHLDKHTRVVGPSLLWVLDIVLLAARSDAGLSVERLWGASRDDGALDFLWEVLRFGRDELGVDPCDALAGSVESARALSLPWVLRQRRLQRWGFPRPRFYVRLAARLLRLRPLDGRLWPRPLDLPNGWIDSMVDRRTVAPRSPQPASSTRPTSSSI